MVKSILAILSSGFWLLARWFKKKDEREPQSHLDEARDAAARGDDAALNRALGDAADRMRDPKDRGS